MKHTLSGSQRTKDVGTDRGARIETAARQALKAFRRDRDKLTYDQWLALDNLEESLYGEGE